MVPDRADVTVVSGDERLVATVERLRAAGIAVHLYFSVRAPRRLRQAATTFRGLDGGSTGWCSPQHLPLPPTIFQAGSAPGAPSGMALSSLHALGFRTAREEIAEILREDGTDADYSEASLEGLEWVLAGFRRPAEEPPALTPDGLHRLLFRAGAHAAEVLLGACAGSRCFVEGR